ncbi:MAG: hypothetical protein NTW95_09100 [Candidatus Aminicenantes bacterium]|nr:hypothetical protein [Candidatus Aminicenantes bacterium]
MKSRRIFVFLAVLFSLTALAAAKESGALTVFVNNWDSQVAFGDTFTIHAQINYQNVPLGRSLVIRIMSADEPQNASLNASRVNVPCQDVSKPDCSGFYEVTFQAHFNKENYGERLVTVDAISETSDSKTQHFLDQYILKIRLVHKPTLTIDKIDAPQPPDTVRVNEPVPVRVTFGTSWLVQDSKVKVTIQATNGGSGQWSWESGKLAGGVIKTSEPIQIKLDKPGRWSFTVTAATTLATAQPKTFTMEAVQEAKRKVGPVTLTYPKPPETVRVGEAVRFDASVGYQDLPAGSMMLFVLTDPATGQDLPAGWQLSRSIAGAGSYRFSGMEARPAAKGNWQLSAQVRLPKLNKPSEYKTEWQQDVVLKVVAEPAADAPGGSSAMQATITRVDRPQGTLKLDEVVPIVVHISYDKLGTLPITLSATVMNLTSHGGQTVSSLPLAKNGTYTFANALIRATPLGKIEVKVEVRAPDGHVLAKKKFYMKVVH